jgi:hypothetical protein
MNKVIGILGIVAVIYLVAYYLGCAVYDLVGIEGIWAVCLVTQIASSVKTYREGVLPLWLVLLMYGVGVGVQYLLPLWIMVTSCGLILIYIPYLWLEGKL